MGALLFDRVVSTVNSGLWRVALSLTLAAKLDVLIGFPMIGGLAIIAEPAVVAELITVAELAIFVGFAMAAGRDKSAEVAWV